MIAIRTPNVSDIEQAIVDQLAAYQALMDRGSLRIERDGEPNSSESDCPWVGVYRGPVLYPTRTLGLGPGFRKQEATFYVMCQESSAESGKACAQLVEALVQDVESALLSDTSLGGAVEALGDFHRVPVDLSKEQGNYFFQTVVIQFTTLVNCTATS